MTRKKQDDRARVAYHEAGHAVMAWLVGRAITQASIVADREEGTAGHVDNADLTDFYPDAVDTHSYDLMAELIPTKEELGAHPTPEHLEFLFEILRQHAKDFDHRVRAEREALIILAGAVAERTFLGKRTRSGHEGDAQHIQELVELTVDNDREAHAYIQWLRHAASAILTLPRNWPVVAALAAALLERSTLTGEEIDTIARSTRQTTMSAIQKGSS